jgi:hypothetical protein
MIPVAIFLFLTGAVLAWAFRVWILIPVSLLAIVATVPLQVWYGASLSGALARALLIGIAPQFGYGFGLLAQHVILLVRHSHPLSSRKTSAAFLYKQRSIDPMP